MMARMIAMGALTRTHFRSLCVVSLLVLVALAGSACRTTKSAVEASGLAPVTWMSGLWRSDDDNLLVEEEWSAPAGGMMLGWGREVKDGRVRFFEQLRLEDRGTGVFYVASPRGEGSTAFALVRASTSEAVFENPAHDDPKRISYRLQPDGSLLARTESDLASHGGHVEEFRMRRVR
jgi:hypothetical protein